MGLSHIPEFWKVVEKGEQVAHDYKCGPWPIFDQVTNFDNEIMLGLQFWKQKGR